MAQMTKLCAPRGRHGRYIRAEHVMKTMLPKPITKHVIAALVCNIAQMTKLSAPRGRHGRYMELITQNRKIAYAACRVVTKTQTGHICAPRRRPGIPHNSARVRGGCKRWGGRKAQGRGVYSAFAPCGIEAWRHPTWTQYGEFRVVSWSNRRRITRGGGSPSVAASGSGVPRRPVGA